MISLSIQIKLIIFSFIYGFLFSYVLDGFNKVARKYRNIFYIPLSFLFTLIVSIIYFIGIQKIGNAIFHIYSILFIIVGFISYDILIKIIENKSKR